MIYFLANYWHLILLIGLLIYGAFTLLRYVFDTRKEVHETKQEVHEIKEQVASVHAVASKIDTQVNDQENITRIENKIDNHIKESNEKHESLLNMMVSVKNHDRNNFEGLKKFIQELGVVESAKAILGKK